MKTDRIARQAIRSNYYFVRRGGTLDESRPVQYASIGSRMVSGIKIDRRLHGEPCHLSRRSQDPVLG
jgi:hypothetical protein